MVPVSVFKTVCRHSYVLFRLSGVCRGYVGSIDENGEKGDNESTLFQLPEDRIRVKLGVASIIF